MLCAYKNGIYYFVRFISLEQILNICVLDNFHTHTLMIFGRVLSCSKWCVQEWLLYLSIQLPSAIKVSEYDLEMQNH